MDAPQFDVVTQRLTSLLTRRRSLGVLAALGISAGLATTEVEAKRKKHKKKKKKCPACAACETCVKGTCRPAVDGAACGANGICVHQVCARKCTFDPMTGGSECAEGLVCSGSVNTVLPAFCTEFPEGDCGTCTSNEGCPAGSACIEMACIVDVGTNCAVIPPA